MKETLDATVAKDKISIPRNEVKKENRLQKIIAILANTVLTFKTVAREDIRTAQIDIPAASDYPVLIIAPNPNRLSIIIRNVGGNNMWIGDYTVNANTGYLLRSFESVTLDRTFGAIYAVSTAGATAAYLEE